MRLYFAPMEGITDEIYHCLHHKHFPGIDKYYIPFISPTASMGLTNREKRSIALKSRDFICVPQVLTKNAENFVATARILADIGYDEVNLNMGCPSGTVTGKGKGSALLRDTDALKVFFDTVFSEKDLIHVSVKTRIGFAETSEWEKIWGVLSAYPFCEITIHTRTRNELYKGAVHNEALKLTDKSQVPIIANGDLFTPDDTKNLMSDYPFIGGAMLGRGIIANPMLHQIIRNDAKAEKEKLRAFHDELLKAYVDDRPVNAALGHMSEIMFYMSNLFEGSKKYLKQMQKSRRTADYIAAADAMFETCPLREEPFYFPF